MAKVNMHEAKSRLSQLVEMAKNGEEVIIAKNGKDEAVIVPIDKRRSGWIGMDAGKIWIADDFDKLPDDILNAFYGEGEVTDEDPD